MKILVGVLVLIALASVALCNQDNEESCPNSCSAPNGNCINGECKCRDNYKGIDCSIYLETLTSGQSVTSSVSDQHFVYFLINVARVSDKLTIDIQEAAGQGSDCDVYVRKSQLPDRIHYDYADLSYAQSYAINIQNPAVSVWFIGVYGWHNCRNFALTATVTTSVTCINGCSGHGTCSNTGVCQCDTGYTGSDCSKQIQLLSTTPIPNTANPTQWAFYYFDVASQPGFTVLMKEDRNRYPDGDADLYVKLRDLPGIFEWDYREVGMGAETSLSVEGPEDGRWFVGVYGFRTVSYTIELHYSTDCPNKCSRHGSCQGEACVCTSIFIGEECEEMVPEMPLSQNIDGFVEHQSWNYYHITPASASNLIIKLEQEGDATSDCDIYVKEGTDPSFFNFDMYDVGRDSTSQIIIENPLGQTWYIGVYGFTSCDYHISVELGAACPNNCGAHGSCVNGRCQCTANYVGEGCEYHAVTLTSKNVTSSAVNKNQWSYFVVTLPSGSTSFTIDLKEKTTIGNVWIYVDQGKLPTLTDYKWKDTSSDSQYHSIYLKLDTTNEDRKFYIGVYGNPNMEVNRIEFDLVTYYPFQ